jgi:hypothetical protein
MDRASSMAFRNLWRAQRAVFVNDPPAQLEAKRRIRAAFRSAKVSSSGKDREKQILIANDTARLLRDSVVQAVYKDEGRYKASFKEIHMTKKGETELI